MPNKHTFRSLEQLLSLKKYEVPSQEAWQQFEHSFQRKLFAACVPQPTTSLRGLFNFGWLLGIKFAFASVFSIALCVSAFFVLKPTKAVFELPKYMAVVQNQVFAKKSVQLSSQRPLMYAASCVVASNHTQSSQQATCYAF